MKITLLFGAFNWADVTVYLVLIIIIHYDAIKEHDLKMSEGKPIFYKNDDEILFSSL